MSNDKKHAKYSPSDAARWMRCPGAIKASEDIEDTSSDFADEGSAAHALAELTLTSKNNCADHLGKVFEKYPKFPVTQEMADYVQTYVDYVRALSPNPANAWYEVKIDMTEVVAGCWGTSDAIIMDGTTLHVVDLKYGKGVPVSAEGNEQMMLYALGAWLWSFEFSDEFEKVVLHVHQPRLDAISTYEMTRKELMSFAERARQAQEAASAPNAPRVPGEKQCRWCRAKARCGELLRVTEDAVLSCFDNELDTLTDAQLSKALAQKALITSWLDAVEDLVKTRLADGHGFPGWKLVSGRTSRDWSLPETEVVGFLNGLGVEEAYSKKILSPAQAEKKLGKTKSAALQEIIAVSTGAPALAPESDKRPAVNVSLADFD